MFPSISVRERSAQKTATSFKCAVFFSDIIFCPPVGIKKKKKSSGSSPAAWQRPAGPVNLPPGGSGRSVGVALRHLRGFWFSRKLGGDEGQAGALADGRPGVDGLGAVGRQNPAVLPDAAGDGQPSLVPHGFCEGQLRRTETKKRLVSLRGSWFWTSGRTAADWSLRVDTKVETSGMAAECHEFETNKQTKKN